MQDHIGKGFGLAIAFVGPGMIALYGASLHVEVFRNWLVTDGWQGYRGLDRLGYSHVRHSQRTARFRGEDPGKLLPAVH